MAEILKYTLPDDVFDLVRHSRPPIKIFGSQNGEVSYAIPPHGASFFGTRGLENGILVFSTKDGKKPAEIVRVDPQTAAEIDRLRDSALREIGITPLQ